MKETTMHQRGYRQRPQDWIDFYNTSSSTRRRLPEQGVADSVTIEGQILTRSTASVHVVHQRCHHLTGGGHQAVARCGPMTASQSNASRHKLDSCCMVSGSGHSDSTTVREYCEPSILMLSVVVCLSFQCNAYTHWPLYGSKLGALTSILCPCLRY